MVKSVETLHPETWKTGWWIVGKEPLPEARPSRYSVKIRNDGDVASAVWMFAARAPYAVKVNGVDVPDDGRRVGLAYALEVKDLMHPGKGEVNEFAAECRGPYVTRLFRCALRLTFADGRIRIYGSCSKNWRAEGSDAEGLADLRELRKDYPPPATPAK